MNSSKDKYTVPGTLRVYCYGHALMNALSVIPCSFFHTVRPFTLPPKTTSAAPVEGADSVVGFLPRLYHHHLVGEVVDGRLQAAVLLFYELHSRTLSLLSDGLFHQGIGQMQLGLLGLLQAGFELVAEGHQLVDFGDDALLLHVWRQRYDKASYQG